jgi:hypothetical protein
LEGEEARHDEQVVLDPMLELTKEDLVLVEKRLELRFGGAALRNLLVELLEEVRVSQGNGGL